MVGIYLPDARIKDSKGILNEKRKQDRQVRHEEVNIRFRLEVYVAYISIPSCRNRQKELQANS